LHFINGRKNEGRGRHIRRRGFNIGWSWPSSGNAIVAGRRVCIQGAHDFADDFFGGIVGLFLVFRFGKIWLDTRPFRRHHALARQVSKHLSARSASEKWEDSDRERAGIGQTGRT